MGANLFWVNELFPKIREFQAKNQNNAKVFQHPTGNLIPLEHAKWNWADYEYAEWYVCNHTRMYFQYAEFWDPIGQETWTEKTIFNFECHLTRFANDKIRAFYKIDDRPGVSKAEFTNDAKGPAGKTELNETEKIQVVFKKSVAVKTQVISEYDDELKNLTNFAWFWHNGDRRADLYNNWNFTSSLDWDGNGEDSMWYNLNTTLLATTVYYKIGSDSIKVINVPLQPEKYILKDMNVTNRILGMPAGWENININKILYSATPDHDADLKSQKEMSYNGTNIVLNLNMNFVERQFILNFYTFADILSKLGGLRASIMTIIGQFSPFFVLFFLLSVTKIIKNKI